MNLSFVLNDYLLIWNLLFGPAISEESYRYKQKLWLTYKKEYNALQNENKLMLQDMKNFIPDDDTIYNFVLESSLFEEIRKTTDKHRRYLMKAWDQNKKKIVANLKDIVRFSYDNYQIFVVHPLMDTVYYDLGNHAKNIVWGRKNDEKNELATLIRIIYAVTRYQIGNKYQEYKEIVQAILELAIHNELYTRMLGRSNYLVGDSSLTYLKKQIYPYWLMYLGVGEDDVVSYMMRDKIAFDVETYHVDKRLKKLDLRGFIEYCIENRQKIISINQLEII